MLDFTTSRSLLFACALLVVPLLTVWDGWTYAQLVREGVTAHGAVMDKTEHHGRSTSYHVEYRFRDESGRLWSGRQSIGSALYRSIRIGQPIEVTYSRSNPGTNVAYLDVLRRQVSDLSFLSLVIGLLAGGCAWWWTYALAKTREYDADVQRHVRPDPRSSGTQASASTGTASA
jgi:Protein of unknown function (DUF3592)